MTRPLTEQLELAARAMRRAGDPRFSTFEVVDADSIRLAPGVDPTHFKPAIRGRDSQDLMTTLHIDVGYGENWVCASHPDARMAHSIYFTPRATRADWARATREVVLQAAAELGAAL